MNKIYKFVDIVEAQYFLNGCVVGKGPQRITQGPSGYFGLIGKTLIFTSPSAATVTFAAASAESAIDPNILQLADIKAQIQAVIATVLVTTVNQKLAFIETTPLHGVAVSAAGTANSILGFDSGNATVGKFFAPPGAASPAVAPAWTWAYSVNENMHVIYTLE